MTKGILIAGFGGQGTLFAGKVLAYSGLILGKELSWLPSYGPEMRGGTSNCSVWISDELIGSPQVLEPDYLIAMNYPSYEKFAPTVAENGMIFADSNLVNEKLSKDSVKEFLIPAADITEKYGYKNGVNMVLLGKLLKETQLFDLDTVEKAFGEFLTGRKAKFIEGNMKAIKTGYNS